MRTIISIQPFIDTINVLKDSYNKLDEDGSIFVIFSTEYDRFGSVEHDFLEIINIGINIGYNYVNTIVYPSLENQDVTFIDNVRYVIWLCKNQEKMFFDKDKIREKHIWKDVEWGKRTKNYNPKGKDPGNVWIPTHDDGKAHITEHILLSDNDVIERIISMTDCKSNMKLYVKKFKKTYLQLKCEAKKEIKIKKVDGIVIFGTSEKMDYIKNNKVNVVITSPPYWNLKDYFKKGQIGQESYSLYIERMEKVWLECYKKLSNNGSLWININIRKHNKKVILIPYDFVKICKKIGFYYRGVIIWHKSSGIPTGDKNIVDRHEYILIFSKRKDFCVNKDVYRQYCDYKNIFINGNAFWNINRKAGSVGKNFIHPAIYPNKLVERIVEITTNDEDIVMDPFLGSGTSLIASVNVNRNFYGYEYNEGFKELMVSRFKNELKNCALIKFVE